MSLHCLIIGAGSIGQRHFDVLSEMGHQCAFLTKRIDIQDKPLFDKLEDALVEFIPDYVIIANETALHAETVMRLSNSGFSGKVLVEKPLNALGLKESQLSFEKIGVAFNLRFHPIIKRLRELLERQEIYSVSVIAGQNLSTWRPSRELSTQYSSQQSLGGGVLRDLSHEFDYAQLLFGDLDFVSAIGGKIGKVTIDADDSWAVLARTNSIPQIAIQLSYLDHQPIRQIRIVTEETTIIADLIAGTLFNGKDVEDFRIVRNETYAAMHKSFLEDFSTAVTTLFEAQQTDELILRIEKSSQTGEVSS